MVAALLGDCAACDMDGADWGPVYHRDYFITAVTGDMSFPHAKRRPHKVQIRLELGKVFFVYDDGAQPTVEEWNVVKLDRNWGPR